MSMSDILTCERSRTGNYGYNYDEWGNAIRHCPICGEASPDYVYKDKDGEFVGCTECLRRLDIYEDVSEDELT